MDNLTKSKAARSIQTADISLDLVALGVKEVRRQNPNTIYGLGKYRPSSRENNYVLTDGKTEYRLVNGEILVTVTEANWVSQPNRSRAILFTEMDNMSVATSIRGWFRKNGGEIKRL